MSGSVNKEVRFDYYVCLFAKLLVGQDIIVLWWIYATARFRVLVSKRRHPARRKGEKKYYFDL